MTTRSDLCLAFAAASLLATASAAAAGETREHKSHPPLMHRDMPEPRGHAETAIREPRAGSVERYGAPRETFGERRVAEGRERFGERRFEERRVAEDRGFGARRYGGFRPRGYANYGYAAPALAGTYRAGDAGVGYAYQGGGYGYPAAPYAPSSGGIGGGGALELLSTGLGAGLGGGVGALGAVAAPVLGQGYGESYGYTPGYVQPADGYGLGAPAYCPPGGFAQ